MKVAPINFTNIDKHIDELSLIHGYTLDDLSLSIPDESSGDFDVGTITDILSKAQVVLQYNGPAQLWIFWGGLAKFVLQDLPVHGCTLIEGREPVVSLTCYDNFELLKRVLVHEVCHAYRINLLGISSQREYASYIGNSLNYLYEELMAISLEKYFNPEISLEDIIGFIYNPQWKKWNSSNILGDFKFKYLLEEESFNEYIKKFADNIPGLLYFLAYKICCETSIVTQIFDFTNKPSKNGFESLLQLTPQSSPNG